MQVKKIFKILVISLATIGLLTIVQWVLIHKDISSGKTKTGKVQRIK
jgi:hypothetical protein